MGRLLLYAREFRVVPARLEQDRCRFTAQVLPVPAVIAGEGSDERTLLDSEIAWPDGNRCCFRIVVDLSDNSAGIDIRQQGRQLIVDFQKTTLPRNLERRMDVADFNTPVVSIDTFAQNGNARMARCLCRRAEQC